MRCLRGVPKSDRRSIVDPYTCPWNDAEHVVDFEPEVPLAAPEPPGEGAHGKPGLGPDLDPAHAHAAAELECLCRRRNNDERTGTEIKRSRKGRNT